MSSFECNCKACGNEIAEVQCTNCKKSDMVLEILLPDKSISRHGHIKLRCPNCDESTWTTHLYYFKKQNMNDTSGLVLDCPRCKANVYPKFREIPFFGELRARQDKDTVLGGLIGILIVLGIVYFIFF